MARPRRNSALAMVMLALVFLAPSGQASPVDDLLPPEGLEAGFDNGTVVLLWQPPAHHGDPVSYRVYHNAHLVGETQDTWYEALLNESVNAFHVTAWYDGRESTPSQPLLVHKEPAPLRALGPVGPVEYEASCEPVGTVVDLDDFPYVFVIVRPECIPLPVDPWPGGDDA